MMELAGGFVSQSAILTENSSFECRIILSEHFFLRNQLL